jgi:hypothetical protein
MHQEIYTKSFIISVGKLIEMYKIFYYSLSQNLVKPYFKYFFTISSTQKHFGLIDIDMLNDIWCI